MKSFSSRAKGKERFQRSHEGKGGERSRPNAFEVGACRNISPQDGQPFLYSLTLPSIDPEGPLPSARTICTPTAPLHFDTVGPALQAIKAKGVGVKEDPVPWGVPVTYN